MHRCPRCRQLRPNVYLHHGQLYCASCLPDDPAEDVRIRARLMQIKARALREEARQQQAVQVTEPGARKES